MECVKVTSLVQLQLYGIFRFFEKRISDVAFFFMQTIFHRVLQGNASQSFAGKCCSENNLCLNAVRIRSYEALRGCTLFLQSLTSFYPACPFLSDHSGFLAVLVILQIVLPQGLYIFCSLCLEHCSSVCSNGFIKPPSSRTLYSLYSTYHHLTFYLHHIFYLFLKNFSFKEVYSGVPGWLQLRS